MTHVLMFINRTYAADFGRLDARDSMTHSLRQQTHSIDVSHSVARRERVNVLHFEAN